MKKQLIATFLILGSFLHSPLQARTNKTCDAIIVDGDYDANRWAAAIDKIVICHQNHPLDEQYPLMISLHHYQLGEYEKAFKWAVRALETRESNTDEFPKGSNDWKASVSYNVVLSKYKHLITYDKSLETAKRNPMAWRNVIKSTEIAAGRAGCPSFFLPGSKSWGPADSQLDATSRLSICSGLSKINIAARHYYSELGESNTSLAHPADECKQLASIISRLRNGYDKRILTSPEMTGITYGSLEKLCAYKKQELLGINSNTSP
ncbi:hypothetical protein [Synechococcus sp. CS-197]|uniref:hypothetical protein n=1 Tax=Synechococcus sp. CS-197 TaxID=2847985 RepID=UPI0001525421|nr:hypothetical protein [Synechococcus sp. CS-197]MCT0250553.1 hypothetical protein [Synechococcus sp. CS-197]CAK23336.1 Hypothetical protein SynWH7803_0910 [Synechococcus sp. WH 7803]